MVIIVSNHLLTKTTIEFPQNNVVIRINVAWIQTQKKLKELLNTIKHDVFLDYPQGRTKPPRPRHTLEDIIALIPSFKTIKYFAVSNVEDPRAIAKIKSQLPQHIQVVPKIETRKGVTTLSKIIDSIDAKYIMLDKEDLYVNVGHNQSSFDTLVRKARATCKRKGVKVLELQGVVFAPHT